MNNFIMNGNYGKWTDMKMIFVVVLILQFLIKLRFPNDALTVSKFYVLKVHDVIKEGRSIRIGGTFLNRKGFISTSPGVYN